MKILHISPYAVRGGCEKDCYLFIKASPEFEQFVLVLGEEGPMSLAWKAQGVQVIHLNSINKSFIKMKSTLDKFLKGKDYDLVIYWSTIRIATVLASLKSSTSKVRVHIGNPLNYSFLQLRKEWVLDKIWGKPQDIKFLPCSDYAGLSFIKAPYFNQFLYETSLNPIDMVPQKRKTPFLSKEKINVGMVARLDPIKNHELLIRAFKRVKMQFPDMILHLVGDGSLRNHLIELTKKLRLVDSVIFYGDVEFVYKHLELWDAFIYCTTLKEGLGSAVTEAMANGLPCLLPDLPMMRELAPEGVKVKWYRADSETSLVKHWVELFENPKQFQEMSDSVFERSLNFNAKRYVQDYIA
jgi:glycosyltransferase involved in cell wall biosynthesis